MRKALLSGCLLAVAAALIVLLGGFLGHDLEHFALLGAALGGVIGLVPHRPAWGKLAGFGVGFALAWVGFALRAAVLPDAPSGRAVAAFLVIVLCVAVCGVSAGRMPLWSALVGAAAIVGAYEATYTNSPAQFLGDSPTAATTVLFAAGLGYLATNLITESQPGSVDVRPAEPDDAEPDDDHYADLDDVLAGESK
jgi:membrane protease YdiL (CAAX protease family)